MLQKSDVIETELRLQKEIEIVRKEIKEIELNLRKEIKDVALSVASTKIQTLIWIGINTAFMLGILAKVFHWWCPHLVQLRIISATQLI